MNTLSEEARARLAEAARRRWRDPAYRKRQSALISIGVTRRHQEREIERFGARPTEANLFPAPLSSRCDWPQLAERMAALEDIAEEAQRFRGKQARCPEAALALDAALDRLAKMESP